MSELRTNRIVPRDGLASGVSGGIIQVKQSVLTSAAYQNINAGANYDWSALTCAITPTRSDSKILVEFVVNISSNSTMNRLAAVLTRDGSAISGAVADSTGDNKTENTVCINAPNANEPYMLCGKFLDSPATTSAVTYGVKIRTGTSSTITIYINRQGSESNNIYIMRGTSSITLMEVSG